MFGKKEDSKPVLPNIRIEKMPDDFYAGANPVVKFKTVEKEITKTGSSAVLSPLEIKKFDKQNSVGANNKFHPANLFSSWKFLLFGSLILIFVGGLVMGAFYYWQYKKSLSGKTTISPPKVIENLNVVSNEPVLVTSTSENSSLVTTTVQLPVYTSKTDFPSTLLSDSADDDKDGLSNIAEDDFKTDPANSDTDKDKYTDGQEIVNLYNPVGVEPMKLLESGLINTYTNPNFGYQLYYPKNWAVGNVDLEYKDVLFSTLSGENIEVKVLDLDGNQNFYDWFGQNAVNEKLSDYVNFKSIFNLDGWVRNDGLVYAFPKNNKIFLIIYHTTDSSVVNYKIVIQMMAKSFQFGNSDIVTNRESEVNVSATVSTDSIK